MLASICLERSEGRLPSRVRTSSEAPAGFLVDAEPIHEERVFEGALAKLSKSAQAMAQVLDEAEAQGFAAGINYQSRETLLAGWRKQLATFQDLGPKKPAPEELTSRRRR